MFVEDEDDDPTDIRENIYSTFNGENQDTNIALNVPLYLINIFGIKGMKTFIDPRDRERGRWDNQVEFILSCIGCIVGLGNLWRFPAKVYEGGGGAFLIPYMAFSLLIGVPMMVLEMTLGQFYGYSCVRAFEFCPILSGLGWTIAITAFLMSIHYTIIIGTCFFYMLSSFQFMLPWSVCTNTFNTPRCINTSMDAKLVNSSILDSSPAQYLFLYVTGEQRADGSFLTLFDPFEKPNFNFIMTLGLLMAMACFITMFGVHVTGKIIYLTVIFPVIAIMQFIILGCTLPGALKGIKYYLYPDIGKLLIPNTYIIAIEQLLFSCGVASGGLITISSFNRFKDKVIRNAMVVLFIDFFISVISGFATFPILGYISYRTGIEIEDLITSDTDMYFIIYPEALATISNCNVWTAIFMFMSVTLGLDSLIVLLETSTMAIIDSSTYHKRKHRVVITTTVCFTTFIFTTIFSLPGGLNWLHIFNAKVVSFILMVSLLLEVISVCYIYGAQNFNRDMKMLSGELLGRIWLILICIEVPACALFLLYIILKDKSIVNRHGYFYPDWIVILAWIMNILIMSPVFGRAVYVLVTYKLQNPNISILSWLKLCIQPPMLCGPKSKQYWVQSKRFAEKMLKYKDNRIFLASFTKYENIDKLMQAAEKKIQATKK